MVLLKVGYQIKSLLEVYVLIYIDIGTPSPGPIIKVG